MEHPVKRFGNGTGTNLAVHFRTVVLKVQNSQIHVIYSCKAGLFPAWASEALNHFTSRHDTKIQRRMTPELTGLSVMGN